MSNHAFVKTKKKVITPEAVNAAIERLNRERFKGLLEVQYQQSDDDVKHYWVVVLKEGGVEYVRRSCWLEKDKDRKFELRHGPDGDIGWWLDWGILDYVAVEVGGRISDEGVGGSWEPNLDKFPTFASFVDAAYARWHVPLVGRWMKRQSMKHAPPSFRQNDPKPVVLRKVDGKPQYVEGKEGDDDEEFDGPNQTPIGEATERIEN